jgi:Kef-type K+ transport system membrane component KefB
VTFYVCEELVKPPGTGLCLFLFLVGLEIDGSIIKRNARLSFSVSLAGMIVPFGLGSALSVAIYHQFVDHSVAFTHFMLFTGVAFSITAFPVLCRILTELKLLDTTVGVVVLSAGVGNDIVGWTLLALSIALVNAGSGLTALWILLACVGWALFLLFIVKRPFLWLARRTGSIENGPTTYFMTATILLLFTSAFFTDVIGVHAIFGERFKLVLFYIYFLLTLSRCISRRHHCAQGRWTGYRTYRKVGRHGFDNFFASCKVLDVG